MAPRESQSALVRTEARVPSLDGTDLLAWVFRPGADAPLPRGVVVALHGCGGLYVSRADQPYVFSARHRGMAEFLAQNGWASVFPDSLTPRGERELCTQRIGQRRINQTQRRADTLGALAWVRQQPWAQGLPVVVLGWSHGGSAVLASVDASHPLVQRAQARQAKADLAVAFYPGCSINLQRSAGPVAATGSPAPSANPAVRDVQTTPAGWQSNTRLLILTGALDDWTPPGPCRELAQAHANATPPVSYHEYPGAYHGFDDPANPVRLRRDVPNGVNPGQGVHAGGNPEARAQAYALLLQQLQALQKK